MRFSDQLLDEIRTRLPVSYVVGRKVALKKNGREFAGLSPFKTEKTPSFFVNDQKAFYHCFASGEHGDIFTFVMKTEGLSFPEAVERLAAEAGVSLPKPQARDEARDDARARLYAVIEAAARFFEQALAGAAGAEARRYLDRRGVKAETIRGFRLGFAPPSRSALREHLIKGGHSLDDLIAAGLLIAGDDIPVAYDRFRNRLMFPITDLKGRAIAFGGRALETDQQPKYLNSPEADLFHKGTILFNASSARTAAHQAGRVIVVEGYMDVVALAEAGFPESVAPLGTALTEDQLRLLWRLAAEPIICFDGDSAGQNAARRAAETALPRLEPGFSLRFATLPAGRDPDDVVRHEGATVLAGILSRPRPLADLLWEGRWSAESWSTPERRAQLEHDLKALCASIRHPTVRTHYERDMRQRLFAAGQAGRQRRDGPPKVYGGEGWGRRATREPYSPPAAEAGLSVKSSSLVAGEGALPAREALLLRTIIAHPWLLDHYAEQIAKLNVASIILARLRDAILDVHAGENSLDSATLHSQLSKAGLDRAVTLILAASARKDDAFAEPAAERSEVEKGFCHTLDLHERLDGLKRSLEAAEKDFYADLSAEAFERIRVLQGELERLSSADAWREREGGS